MTRTALRLHVLTAISPPKLLISRRAPERTWTVVSVCCVSASAASVARVVSMLVYPPPSSARRRVSPLGAGAPVSAASLGRGAGSDMNSRSEEHTSELQSRPHLVCRLLLEKKKKKLQHQTCPHITYNPILEYTKNYSQQ